jgi:hypothetical protein
MLLLSWLAPGRGPRYRSDMENDESMSGSRTPTGSYMYTPISGSASLSGSGSGSGSGSWQIAGAVHRLGVRGP